ncbi:hypothetical protein GDO81_020792, partial [Engystomops pustulosus]
QTLLAEHHGVVDPLGLDQKEHEDMAACYHLLLQNFNTLLSWNGFSQPENSDLLRSALAVFANRIKESDPSVDVAEGVR